MTFEKDFYDYLNSHNLLGIKGGLERPTFLDIWIVSVGDRVFARTWNKSERSWFTAFQQTGVGEIRFGDRVVKVRGRKLENEPETNLLIDQAYLNKYNQGEENIFYAKGITQPEYADCTMEFFAMES